MNNEIKEAIPVDHNTDPEKENIEAQTGEDSEDSPSYFGIIFNTGLFAYNCYAVTNNICVGDGYWYVAFGIIINIGILIYYAGQFENIFPKLNKNIAYGILGVVLLLGIMVGCSSQTDQIEKAAKPK